MPRRTIIFMLTLLGFALIWHSAAQQTASVTIFADRDSLTLYLPDQGTISLEGLSFFVSSNRPSYPLSQYSGFDPLV